jgi:hypothetical protein
LAKKVGLHAATMYAELLSKSIYFNQRGRSFQGEFYCTVENMEDATTLSRHQQEKAVKILIQIGLIRRLLKGQPCKRYFYVYDDLVILRHILDSKTSDIEELASRKASDKKAIVLDGDIF